MRTHRRATGWRSWRKSYALLAAVAMACGPAAHPTPTPVNDAGTKHVLVFSDLHFDPFADTTIVKQLVNADVSRWRTIFEGSTQRAFSQYGSDSNYPLVMSSLAAMHRTEPAAQLVLFAGDFLAHHFQDNFRKFARDTSAVALAAFTYKTNEFLAQLVGDAFPTAQVLPTLGNNDSVCGDYMSQPGSEFLRSFANAWQPIVNRHGSATDFAESFARAGHYATYVPVIRARVVVLNDVYLSSHYSDACGTGSNQPAHDAIAWLDGVLTDSRSRGERVWLLTHVPMGVDVFASLKTDSVVSMLAPAQGSALISLIRRFGTTVRYGIYGHTHMNEFRVVSDPSGNPLLATLGISAVSPIYSNNPAFVVLSVDAVSGAITNYTVHTLKNLALAGVTIPAEWSKEYDFNRAFGADGLSAPALDLVHRALLGNTDARASFLRFYDSGSGRTRIGASWRAYWCSMENLEPAPFARCNRQP